MHNSEKYPELWEKFESLRAEKEEIEAKSKPFREQRDKLDAQINELTMQRKDAAEKIVSIERPRIVEVKNQIAALARAMGARSLKAEPANIQK